MRTSDTPPLWPGFRSNRHFCWRIWPRPGYIQLMVNRPASLTVEVDISESLVRAAEAGGGGALAERLRLLLLVDLVRTRQIGPNRGAREAGMGLLDFYKVLKKHRVPAIDMEPDEFDEEMATIQRILAAS